MKNEKKYYVGIDAGTNSVGYAVTYDDYTLVKYKGEPMWGVTIFDSGNLCDERRNFRSARRRLNRRQQRVYLMQEIFAKEISKIDSDFYLRIHQSSLFREDKSNPEKYNVFFNDDGYNDTDYYKDYPTIHHLIYELMNSDKYHDARLVYIACAWLAAHRGHFLSDVSKENISDILDFEPIYNDFIKCFVENDIMLPWECNCEEFEVVLKENTSVTVKDKAFVKLLFGGKKTKDTKDGDYPYNRSLMVKLLAGGKVKASDLFFNEQYSELGSFSLSMNDEEFAAFIAEIEPDSELVLKLKAMYDWSILNNVLNGEKSISYAKIKIYEQHKRDLHDLKGFVKRNCPHKYNDIFRSISEKNYSAYTGHTKNNKKIKNNASQEEFYVFLKKQFKNISVEENDMEFFEDMTARMEMGTFLPKQVNGDNRVIPYQLYWYELNELLAKAEKYLPFISESDNDGITNKEKILSVFEYRIPYFVGPLVSSEKSKFAWMKRKADGIIYPWNIKEKVDFDASEQEFIKRMTNTCTYIPGEKVLPQNSLLYVKYEILNIINNIKINGQAISVEIKQKMYEELVLQKSRVSPKNIKDYLITVGAMTKNDVISGIDTQLSVAVSAKPYFDFRNLLNNGILTEKRAEEIIERCTYSEDRYRLRKWIDSEFADLPEKERKYIYTMKYKGFGRLSGKLLCGINGVCRETGEVATVIDFLWNTNDNLMQILSDKYTFAEEIEKIKNEYYTSQNYSLNEMLDDMYISNSVKRPIFRTLDIVNDIVKTMGYEPEKIFIEMARGAEENQKNNRTKSRKQQITELYSKIDTEDVRNLSKQLEELGDTADNKLQSDVLFLYFMQLGRCMYSGEMLDIDKLKQSVYNIDHIYPQCNVKDDSILNNKVLVLSERNSDKGDTYPIKPEWQNKMNGFWSMLYKNGLITDEKYKRLKRTTRFTDDEKYGFINRQLVETRQSTKAIKKVLGNKYSSESVCVKAGLVSDFRKEYDMLKARSINDLHHAKDAYLNIVVGNVYNERFTKKWFNISDKYSLKVKTLFGNSLKVKDEIIWSGEESVAFVKKIMRKNCIHFTRYAFCRKGGFFDQQPKKASAGLVPLKKGMDTEKYGGYNGTTATYFVLALYTYGKKKELTFVPIELMYSQKFEQDEDFARQYITDAIKNIHNKNVKELSFPLGKRKIKINTVLSFDGYKVAITGKSSGGKQIGITSLVSLVVPYETEKYIKSLERFAQKLKINPNIVINTEYDGISEEKNIELYKLFADKLSAKPFSIMRHLKYEVITEGEMKFKQLPLDEQVLTLLNILFLFKTCRTGGVDLTAIGGDKTTGTLKESANMSNWGKYYNDIRIIDTSASGLHTKESMNLLELL